jgi:D-sedoheptulose 7-phosphate isomerase
MAAHVARYFLETEQLAASMRQGEIPGTIATIAEACVGCLRAGGKLMFAGNGGSASDAQHLATEFVNHFLYDRPSLSAMALNADTSVMTAISNDYGYDHVFARQVIALGRPGDVFFGISTSGRSLNIVNAFSAAKTKGLITVGMTGASGFVSGAQCDFEIRVPSAVTPHIQEGHIMAGHAVSLVVEECLFPRAANRDQVKDSSSSRMLHISATSSEV